VKKKRHVRYGRKFLFAPDRVAGISKGSNCPWVRADQVEHSFHKGAMGVQHGRKGIAGEVGRPVREEGRAGWCKPEQIKLGGGRAPQQLYGS